MSTVDSSADIDGSKLWGFGGLRATVPTFLGAALIGGTPDVATRDVGIDPRPGFR
jgi:hypothetical protein